MNKSKIDNFQLEPKLNSEQIVDGEFRHPLLTPNPMLCAAFSVYNEPLSELYNMDCIQGMKHYPNKYFDLAICDPPYGLGMHNAIGNGDKRNGIVRNKVWAGGEWDNEIPNIQYFTELLRVSKNQIIWGGNYFAHLLPKSDKWLVWDKMQRVNQSDCELAWTSFKGALRIYQFHCSKLQGFMNPNRFHPTEKPINLYQWILENYAEKEQKILDTHVGSGSSRIACYKNGFDFVGFEIDKQYCEASEKRFINAISQQRLQF